MSRIELIMTALMLPIVACGIGSSHSKASENMATVTGPITGGKHGKPFAAPEFDLGKYNYITEEFFVEGKASTFDLAPGTKQTPDGKWTLQRQPESAPFKAGILVVRPRDASKFNGTVVVFWQNVTGGFELPNVTEGEYLRGYAWVGVSAQKIGIHGFTKENNQGLRAWDPERYGSLDHPGDDYSFDILTQVGRAIGTNRKISGTDPMAGLPVKRVVAVGGSQSAGRLRAYINGIHPFERVFQGYIPYIDWTTMVPFREPPAGVRTGAALGFAGNLARPRTKIRDDLDVPVFVVNSETEVITSVYMRQPDTDKFRFWETAGTAHSSVPRAAVDDPDAQARGAIKVRDLNSPNWLSYRPAYDAAVRHMHVWLVEGKAPPKAPLIEVGPAPDYAIQRDANGNAKGGIRLPEIDAPVAEHRGPGTALPGGYSRGYLFGYAKALPQERLRELYPNSAAYLKAYDASMAKAVSAGYVLAEDVQSLRKPAEVWAKRLDQ